MGVTEGQSGDYGNRLEVRASSPARPESPNIVVKIQEDLADLEKEDVEQILTDEEKRFLLYVERGDVPSVKHIIKKGMRENEKKEGSFNINCLDPLGRSALIISIENENMDMIEMLLKENIESRDALLFAISEEYVEGVEALLVHEENIHKPGDLYSWEKTNFERTTFTPDITPLILAAHRNNYEILKLLLDRGATLPMPHDVKCACDECLVSSADDSLRHSHSRINAYKALSSPSLICLSSKDPLVTAFTLSEDLENLAGLENEFMDDYTSLRQQVEEFSMALVEETRTITELEIMLNYDPEGVPYQHGDFMHLARLKDAVNNNQKSFVAHSNVQQLLARVWYDGMPGFKRRSLLHQVIDVAKIGCIFPIYCIAFVLCPNSSYGTAMKKPFIKFIVHSSCYCFFLLLLVVVSLRVETQVIELFGSQWMLELLRQYQREARGGFPSMVEILIVIFIFGFIWGEMRSLWEDGLAEYLKDLWNIVDYITNFFYMNWIFLRLTAFFLTQRAVSQGQDPYFPREMWPDFDPMLISEGMFGAGNILSFLKLVHIFSVNHHMGPLQIALGRMVIDIIKFFFIYTLVLFAFGCGLNQLLWYYADMDMRKCYSLPGGARNPTQENSCAIWRRFSNLFETSQSLFWASFGLVDLRVFELTGIKSYTRFWSMLIFGSYNVINVIVLLNLLIAMMSNSYAFICAKCDTEWKFARSRLWMSYFEEGRELPSPFNLVPNFGALVAMSKKVPRASFKHRQDTLRESQYQGVMRNLVRRYVTKEQRLTDDRSINEDDINEVKQDINSFKYEIVNILKINNWDTGTAHHKTETALGKKQQTRERRLLKGFNIGLVEGLDATLLAGVEKSLNALTSLHLKGKKKKDWNQMVRKSVKNRDHIGSTTTSIQRQNLREFTRQGSSKKWKSVQFYQKRGVFMGGEINKVMLNEVSKCRKAQLVPRYGRGWRALQSIQADGNLSRDGLESKIRKVSLSRDTSSIDTSSSCPSFSRQPPTPPLDREIPGSPSDTSKPQTAPSDISKLQTPSSDASTPQTAPSDASKHQKPPSGDSKPQTPPSDASKPQTPPFQTSKHPEENQKLSEAPKKSVPNGSLEKPAKPKPYQETKSSAARTSELAKTSAPEAMKPAATEPSELPQPLVPKPSEAPKPAAREQSKVSKPAAPKLPEALKPPATEQSDVSKPAAPKSSEVPKSQTAKPSPPAKEVTGVSLVSKQKKTGWL
nr:transient receptor potential protein-like isoform X1 [Cherax quadricarinatus]